MYVWFVCLLVFVDFFFKFTKHLHESGKLFLSLSCIWHNTITQSFEGAMHLCRNNPIFYPSTFSWTLLSDSVLFIQALVTVFIIDTHWINQKLHEVQESRIYVC